MEKIIIYTDGACKYNPGPGGWATIINIFGKNIGKKGYEIITTNNIMELTAVIEALKYIDTELSKRNDNGNIGFDILVNTDSAYIVNAFGNNWIEKWKSNGWKSSSKEDVKNKKLWIELSDLVTKYNVKINKVKGHSNDKLNNKCDEYAVKESEKAFNELIELAKSEGFNIADEVGKIEEYIQMKIKKIETKTEIKTEIEVEKQLESESELFEKDLVFDEELIEKENEKELLKLKEEKAEFEKEENLNKEIRQSDTIFTLLKENDQLKKENIRLKKEIEELKK